MADAELNPQRIGLVVEYREERLSLPAERLEAVQLAIVRIVLKRDCPSFEKIVGHPRCRREI